MTNSSIHCLQNLALKSITESLNYYLWILVCQWWRGTLDEVSFYRLCSKRTTNRKKKKNATLSLTGTNQEVWRPSAPLSLSKWNKNAFVWIVQGKTGQNYYCAWCLEVGQTISITICHNAFCYDGTIDRLAPCIDNFIKTCKDLMHFPASLTYQSHYLMILLDWSHQMKDDKVTKVIKDDVRKKCSGETD